MGDGPFVGGLREVVADQTVPEKCREFMVHTGTGFREFIQFKFSMGLALSLNFHILNMYVVHI